jgi:hypothetical protein
MKINDIDYLGNEKNINDKIYNINK